MWMSDWVSVRTINMEHRTQAAVMEEKQPEACSSTNDLRSQPRPEMSATENTETSQNSQQPQQEVCIETDGNESLKNGCRPDNGNQCTDTESIPLLSKSVGLESKMNEITVDSVDSNLIPNLPKDKYVPQHPTNHCGVQVGPVDTGSLKTTSTPTEGPGVITPKEVKHDISDKRDPKSLLQTEESEIPNDRTKEKLSSSTDLGGGGDRTKAGFDPADSLRLHRIVLGAVQELRMRRAVDSENEDRIRQLMVEKQETEEKYQESVCRTSELKTLMAEKVAQARKENQSAVQDLTEAKAKLQSTYEQSEKEVKSLKDEIRALQLTKYTLEKKVREQERKAEVTSSASDTHLTRLPDLEEKCNMTMNRANELAAACTRLEKNVKEAVRVNTRLAYENSHKTCQVDQYRADVKRLNKLLTAANTEKSYQPKQQEHQLGQLGAHVATLERQLQKEKDTTQLLQKQLECSRTEQKQLGQSLADAHAIISQQSDLAGQAVEDLEAVTQKLDRLDQDHTKLVQEYGDLKDSAQEERDKHGEQCKQLEKEISEVREQLEGLTTRHREVQENREQLEQLNSDWASRNVTLLDQIKDLKAELEKPKTDAGNQTSLETAEVESQTQVAVLCSSEVQTVCSSLYSIDGWAQTTYTATAHTTCQTDVTTTTGTASQTLEVKFENKLVQTYENDPSSGILQGDVQVVDKVLETSQKCEEQEVVCPTQQTEPPVIAVEQDSPEKKVDNPETNKTQVIKEPEAEMSPYKRFSASLRNLRSQQSRPLAEHELLSRRPERGNRLKRRSTETVFSESTKVVKGPTDGAIEVEPVPKSPTTGRFSFQFLHIPELEKQAAIGVSSVPDMSQGKDEEKTENADEAEVEGAKDMESDMAEVTVIPATPLPPRSMDLPIPIDPPSSPPAPPGILSGPRDSKVKQHKKVHFAESAETDGSAENSDSDVLFSEDEEKEVIELRNSQVSRIERVLLDGGSQV